MAAVYNPAAFQGGQVAIPAPVSSSYVVPYVAQFVIDQKVLTLSSGKFTINDSKGTLLFDVKGKNPLGLHTKRVLRDASGKVLLLLQKKIVTMHDRWAVYRGDDDNTSNLLFTVGKAFFQFTPSFEVFLGANSSSRPDFIIKGDIFEHNYAIYYNNTAIAEVRKKINVQSVFMGKDQYGVTVFPGADHAFIAALIVVVDQQKQDDQKEAKKNNGQ